MVNFPQVREQDASPEVAAIYADIRAVSGLPVVNLIWRHFAAWPGVLPWAWDAVSPLVASSGMDAARQRIASGVTLPSFAPLSIETWHAAGAFRTGMQAIASILDGYIRGNLTNIVALTALRLRLEHPDRPAAALLAVAQPTRPPPLLDPLPQLSDLEPALAAQIRELSALHDGVGDGVIPSLYLALSAWPGVIAALPVWLSALYEPQALRTARASTCRVAEAEVQTLIPSPGPRPEALDQALPALDRFTRLVIPDLIPVCLALQQLLPTR